MGHSQDSELPVPQHRSLSDSIEPEQTMSDGKSQRGSPDTGGVSLAPLIRVV
jgi:hypothetical protein